MTYKYLWAIAALLFLFSCTDDDIPDDVNEEELITTLKYSLTPVDGGTTLEMSFVDLDGDGGNSATITGATLMANTEYNGVIELLNESVSPAENITEEVEEEAAEHQLFFDISIDDCSTEYLDTDANNFPIGLSTKFITGAAASGNLTIILKHEPVKDASGVSMGDITNAAGETDIQVVLPIVIQ